LFEEWPASAFCFGPRRDSIDAANWEGDTVLILSRFSITPVELSGRQARNVFEGNLEAVEVLISAHRGNHFYLVVEPGQQLPGAINTNVAQHLTGRPPQVCDKSLMNAALRHSGNFRQKGTRAQRFVVLRAKDTQALAYALVTYDSKLLHRPLTPVDFTLLSFHLKPPVRLNFPSL
jgi:hypothetical protein